MSNLTLSQQQALVLDKNISVTAGAGSGKTKILVERYLKIVLENPAKVRRVLAFTFTNKAAGEMQERVASEISKRLKEVTDSQTRSKLLNVRDQLNSASISTIHSFCARILREFPLEAGLSPDFHELDEMRQTILQQEAIKKVFEEINKSEDYQKQWYYLFSRLGRRAVESMLDKALSTPFEMAQIVEKFRLITEEQYLEFLADQWLNLVKSIVGEIDFPSLHQLINEIIKIDNVKNKNTKGQELWDILIQSQDLFHSDSNNVDNYQIFLKLAKTMTTAKGLAYKNAQYLGGKDSWAPDTINYLIQLSNQCEPAAKNFQDFDPGEPANENDREWYRIFCIFSNLFDITSTQYTELKQEQGYVDFEDLQILTLNLIKKNERISKELRKRFDFILVDEFQDTNGLQWEIIKQLSIKNQKLSTDKIFVVGDPKQSIYGFRNADIRIFQQVKNIFAEQFGCSNENEYEGNVVFSDGFRFLPRLNSFINYMFSKILQEESNNPFEVGYNPLKTKRELEGKGEIELALLEAREDRYQHEADYIAGSIQDLIGTGQTCFKWEGEEKESPIQYGDIAILLRQRTHLLEIEQALRKQNIPFKTAGGIGYWQKQEIYDFYFLLRFISNPKDDFACIAVLRSKLFMISDSALFLLSREQGNTYWDRLNGEFTQMGYSTSEIEALTLSAELINKWLEKRDRINLADLLNIILGDLQFRAILAAQLNGEQLLANIDKLIEQAQNYDAAGLGGLQDFLNNLDEIIDREMREGEAPIALEDIGTVKIMTIHAAKGLQFPIVFVPYLNTKLSGSRDSIYVDSELGFATKLNSGVIKSTSENHVLLNLLKYRQRQKDLAESKRLFYVAVTRASNRLFLSADLDSKEHAKDSALSWINTTFEQDNINIFEQDCITKNDFEINIVRQFEPIEKYYHNFKEFEKGINKLKEFVKNPKPDSDSIPDYLMTLSDDVGPRTFSATRIMTYLNNPDEYFQRYHLGFFEQDYESFADDVYKSDHGLLKGKIIHRYLELITSSNLSPDDLIQNILFEYDVFDTELREQFLTEVKYLTNRLKQSDIGKPILNAEIFRNEVSITTSLGNNYFTGTLDRLFKNTNGIWEVVDYKTNRIRSDQVEEEVKKYEWQIKAYALLLSKLYPDQHQFPISLYFLYPDQLYQRRFSKEEADKIGLFFLNTLDEINARFPCVEV